MGIDAILEFIAIIGAGFTAAWFAIKENAEFVGALVGIASLILGIITLVVQIHQGSGH